MTNKTTLKKINITLLEQLPEKWNFLTKTALLNGFCAIGITSAKPVPSFSVEIHKKWLKLNKNAQMSFFDQNQQQRFNPTHKNILKNASAIICAAIPYAEGATQDGLWKHVAAHARSRDYHKTMKLRLGKLAAEIKRHFPNAEYRVFVDSAPIMERTWATLCGIGYIGKNGSLIVPGVGSKVVLGEIVLSGIEAPKTNAQNKIDTCADCNKCIQSCPTGALNNKIIDANICLSYQTIENKNKPILKSVENKITTLFGCDECTKVCPKNNSSIKCQLEIPANTEPSKLSVKQLITMKDDDILSMFEGTCLRRTGAWALKRNAILLSKNKG